jgi:hypothetical protein
MIGLQNDADKELRFLYEWWTHGRKEAWDDWQRRADAYYDTHPETIDEMIKGLNRPTPPDRRALWDESERLEELDNEMLRRLIEVRQRMWT